MSERRWVWSASSDRPPLDEHDGRFRVVLLVDAAGGATRLVLHPPLDGAQDFEDVSAPLGRGQDPDGPDDHVHGELLDPCQGGPGPDGPWLTH